MMLRDWCACVLDASTHATLAQVQRADAFERAELHLRGGYSPKEFARICAADELLRRDLRRLARNHNTDGGKT